MLTTVFTFFYFSNLQEMLKEACEVLEDEVGALEEELKQVKYVRSHGSN
jgi:hypothetical protein